MSNNKDSIHVVLLINSTYASAQPVCAGAMRYAAEHPEIILRICGLHPEDDDFAYALDWKTDGIISGFCPSITYRHQFHRKNPKCPVVFCGGIPTVNFRKPSAAVLCDNRAIASAAANLLVRHGLRNFAFIGTRKKSPWNDERRRAFAEIINEHGCNLHLYKTKRPSQCKSGEYGPLATWLKELPKPCGIFASHDQRAVHVLDICRREGISIPEQIQLVGVDNEAWICERTSPTLSSIEQDFEGCGYAATDTLVKMIRGERHAKLTLFGVSKVVERMSTTDLHGNLSRALRARDFIREHATEVISVPGIAIKLNIPLRVLQSSYRKAFGKTIQEELALIRLDKVKELLRTTTLPIDKVTKLAGFGSSLHLMRLFKRTTGLTMLAYRRKTGY